MYRVVMVAFLGACGGSDGVIGPGILEFYSTAPMIDIASSAAVGEPIRVGITTYGSGCGSIGPTDSQVVAGGADIHPLDVFDDSSSEDDPPCTSALLFFSHEATLIFVEPGAMTVRIHGRRVNGNVDAEVALERPVTVE